MISKRSLVILAAADLAIAITMVSALVFSRPVQNAGLIPVTGPSSSGVQLIDKNARRNLAADKRSVTNMGESPQEEYVLSQQYHAADDRSVTKTGESPEEEYVLSQQYHAADNRSVTKTGESPEEEYILSQQYHAADNNRVTK